MHVKNVHCTHVQEDQMHTSPDNYMWYEQASQLFSSLWNRHS